MNNSYYMNFEFEKTKNLSMDDGIKWKFINKFLII
jgi:hypothetical protein